MNSSEIEKVSSLDEALSSKRAPTQDVLGFCDAVNAAHERAEWGALTLEEIKALTVLTGIGDDMSDVRQRSLKFLEERRKAFQKHY